MLTVFSLGTGLAVISVLLAGRTVIPGITALRATGFGRRGGGDTLCLIFCLLGTAIAVSVTAVTITASAASVISTLLAGRTTLPLGTGAHFSRRWGLLILIFHIVFRFSG